MKSNFRKAIAALALTLMLTSSAFADDGIMHTDAPAPQPSPTSDGVIHTGVTDDGIMHTDWTDTLTEVGLSLVQVLSRF